MTRKKPPRRTGFWSEPIPLLTKVYQCGKEGLHEVEWLFQSFPAPYRALLDPDQPDPDDPDQDGPFTREQKQMLSEVGLVCRLAQSAMQTIYEQQGILPEVLAGLNFYLENRVVRLVYKPSVYHQRTALMPLYYEKPERPLFVEKERLRQQRQQEAEAKDAAFEDAEALRRQRAQIVDKGLVPVNGIQEEIEERTEATAAGVIARELKRLLLEDSRLLSRCEDCQSIFERNRNRPGQRFCSIRCADRYGQRRRKREKSAKSQPALESQPKSY